MQYMHLHHYQSRRSLAVLLEQLSQLFTSAFQLCRSSPLEQLRRERVAFLTGLHSLTISRKAYTEVKKVREVNKSMTIDKDKDLLKNTSRKTLSRVNHRSRNKHNSTNDNSEKDKSSRYDPQSHNAIEACQVCGNIASTHVHYGGRSCQSCRAFFRRSVVKFSK